MVNVLSLFDGICCAKVALDKSDIYVNKYFSYEIKKSAIKVSEANHPDLIRCGDIHNFTMPDCSIDYLFAGSPCQNLSIARTSANYEREGLNGRKSSLFYKAIDILKAVNPKYFLFENVVMPKKDLEIFNNLLGVEPIIINSNKLSYQNRKRLYWTNIDFDKNIVDKNISFQDFIGVGNLNEAIVNKTPSRLAMWNNGYGRTDIKSCNNITYSEKIGCLLRKQDRAPNSGLIEHGDFCRYLTRAEMEIAQNLPIGYTDSVSYNQAQDVLGDCWTVDVIAHILKTKRN